jgi:Na+/melibiose symporter-like transporter
MQVQTLPGERCLPSCLFFILKEKIGYALGDAGTNIAWRTMSTFLLIFYTDVYGLPAAAAGVLLLITRLSDGITDIIMGIIGDRTQTDKGKFRPWILWTAVPFGAIMALTFTTPPFGMAGKLIYAYVIYILYTLIYTANNVPYGALMGVMTSDEQERTSLSSFRFAGAYFGGILTQGLLIYFVLFFGNTGSKIEVNSTENKGVYQVMVTSPEDVETAAISMKSGLSAKFLSQNPAEKLKITLSSSNDEADKGKELILFSKDSSLTSESINVSLIDVYQEKLEESNYSISLSEKITDAKYNLSLNSFKDEQAQYYSYQLFVKSKVPFTGEVSVNNDGSKLIDASATNQVSFSLKDGQTYYFTATDIQELKAEDIQCINQKQGYQNSVYILSVLLIIFLVITYASTRERVKVSKEAQGNVKDDLKDLLTNKPWLLLLFVGFVFCIYNGIKQGVTVMYFKRYLNAEALSAIYFVVLLVVSGIAALTTGPMAKKIGKKSLFVYVMLFSALTNAALIFAGPQDTTLIFLFGIYSRT